MVTFELLHGQPPFADDDALRTYQKILEGKIKFPHHFDRLSKDLIKRLLTADVARRLGCRKDGVAELKAHAWFVHEQDGAPNQHFWDDIVSGRTRAPISPLINSETDSGNFERYPDSLEVSGSREIDVKDQALFADFDAPAAKRANEAR